LSGFQSSPVPKDGCNAVATIRSAQPARFNPHPSRRTGATFGDAGNCLLQFGFNPHPSRRTGATWVNSLNWRRTVKFQSSPVPKDGCNAHASPGTPGMCGFNPHPSRRTGATVQLVQFVRLQHVSILTRPEGRVQRERAIACEMPSSFNPHPSRRTGATVQLRLRNPRLNEFQSSPVPKDGCNTRRLHM